MRRKPIPSVVLAVALAVLLPLEQAHCVWMGLERHGSPAAAVAPGHECCASSDARLPVHQSRPDDRTPGCICGQLPPGALPPFVSAAVDPPVMPVAVLTVPMVLAPVPCVIETAPTRDVGSPPLPDDPGAHGLRAPPVSA